MSKLISILLLCVLCSCNKEAHTYKMVYNPSPTHFLQGTTMLGVRTHFFVFCSQLNKEEELCLIKQDSTNVSQIDVECFNFKLEYLGTDTEFSNPENFECK